MHESKGGRIALLILMAAVLVYALERFFSKKEKT